MCCLMRLLILSLLIYRLICCSMYLLILGNTHLLSLLTIYIHLLILGKSQLCSPLRHHLACSSKSLLILTKSNLTFLILRKSLNSVLCVAACVCWCCWMFQLSSFLTHKLMFCSMYLLILGRFHLPSLFSFIWCEIACICSSWESLISLRSWEYIWRVCGVHLLIVRKYNSPSLLRRHVTCCNTPLLILKMYQLSSLLRIHCELAIAAITTNR